MNKLLLLIAIIFTLNTIFSQCTQQTCAAETEACSVANPCSDGLYCDIGGDNTCFTYADYFSGNCTQDSDCKSAAKCYSNQCVEELRSTYPCDVSETPDRCRTSCVNGFCAQIPAAGSCTTYPSLDHDCAFGYYCDGTDTCVAEIADGDSCSFGVDDAKCEGYPGAFCAGDPDARCHSFYSLDDNYDFMGGNYYSSERLLCKSGYVTTNNTVMCTATPFYSNFSNTCSVSSDCGTDSVVDCSCTKQGDNRCLFSIAEVDFGAYPASFDKDLERCYRMNGCRGDTCSACDVQRRASCCAKSAFLKLYLPNHVSGFSPVDNCKRNKNFDTTYLDSCCTPPPASSSTGGSTAGSGSSSPVLTTSNAMKLSFGLFAVVFSFIFSL